VSFNPCETRESHCSLVAPTLFTAFPLILCYDLFFLRHPPNTVAKDIWFKASLTITAWMEFLRGCRLPYAVSPFRSFSLVVIPLRAAADYNLLPSQHGLFPFVSRFPLIVLPIDPVLYALSEPSIRPRRMPVRLTCFDLHPTPFSGKVCFHSWSSRGRRSFHKFFLRKQHAKSFWVFQRPESQSFKIP